MRAVAGVALLWAAAAAASPQPVATLKGEWWIVAIDGRSTAATPNLNLRADARRIWWEPSRAGYILKYRIRGVHFSAGDPFKGSRGGAPDIICTIAPPIQVPAIFHVLSSATQIERTGSGALEISGAGHSLQLVSRDPASAAIPHP